MKICGYVPFLVICYLKLPVFAPMNANDVFDTNFECLLALVTTISFVIPTFSTATIMKGSL